MFQARIWTRKHPGNNCVVLLVLIIICYLTAADGALLAGSLLVLSPMWTICPVPPPPPRLRINSWSWPATVNAKLISSGFCTLIIILFSESLWACWEMHWKTSRGPRSPELLGKGHVELRSSTKHSFRGNCREKKKKSLCPSLEQNTVV